MCIHYHHPVLKITCKITFDSFISEAVAEIKQVGNYFTLEKIQIWKLINY